MRTLTIRTHPAYCRKSGLDDYGKNRLVIGRKEELCDIVISDSIMSKVHGTFFFQGERTVYADCRSSNGTYIEEAGDKKTSQ